MPTTRRADVLVPAQVLAAAGVLAPFGAPRWPLSRAVRAAARTAVVAGSLLAAGGAVSLGRDLTPWVTPRLGGRLRTGGAYAVSRNPIYAGMLLAAGGQAILRARPEPLAAGAALAAVLHVKTGVEEHRLTARFGPAYTDYASRVPRLLGRPRHRPAP